jgi:hypothetical protein
MDWSPRVGHRNWKKFKIVETYWHYHSLESSWGALSDGTIMDSPISRGKMHFLHFSLFFLLRLLQGECRKQFCLSWLPRAVDFKVSCSQIPRVCLHRDSNPRPYGWESDVLTIRPRRSTSALQELIVAQAWTRTSSIDLHCMSRRKPEFPEETLYVTYCKTCSASYDLTIVPRLWMSIEMKIHRKML